MFSLTNFFRKDSTAMAGRPRMVIPSIKDQGNWRRQEKVEAQCKACAEQLASSLYRWPKDFPSKSTLKTWDNAERCFLGMDLSLLTQFLMNHYVLTDGTGVFDVPARSTVSLIWEAACAPDSPLPIASWSVELARKQEAQQP